MDIYSLFTPQIPMTLSARTGTVWDGAHIVELVFNHTVTYFQEIEKVKLWPEPSPETEYFFVEYLEQVSTPVLIDPSRVNLRSRPTAGDDAVAGATKSACKSEPNSTRGSWPTSRFMLTGSGTSTVTGTGIVGSTARGFKI